MKIKKNEARKNISLPMSTYDLLKKRSFKERKAIAHMIRDAFTPW